MYAQIQYLWHTNIILLNTTLCWGSWQKPSVELFDLPSAGTPALSFCPIWALKFARTVESEQAVLWMNSVPFRLTRLRALHVIRPPSACFWHPLNIFKLGNSSCSCQPECWQASQPVFAFSCVPESRHCFPIFRCHFHNVVQILTSWAYFHASQKLYTPSNFARSGRYYGFFQNTKQIQIQSQSPVDMSAFLTVLTRQIGKSAVQIKHANFNSLKFWFFFIPHQIHSFLLI